MTGPATHGRGGREFAIDTVVVAATQLIVRLRGLVLLPLIVNLLGTAAYGVWAQVVAFASFVSALVSLNFHLPLVREIAADRSSAGVVYTSLLLATLAISGVVGGVLALLPGPIGVVLLDSGDAARFVQLGLLLMLVNNVRMLNTNLYRATDRLAIRSASELLSAVGEVVGILITLRRDGSVEDVLVFMVAWNGVIAGGQTIHGFAIAGWRTPRWSIVAAAVRYAVPLLPASFANFALDRIDRFVVGYYHGAEGVGIYAANYAIAGLVMMAQTPFQITLLPKVAALWDRDRDQAARYIEISMAVFLTLAIPFVVGVPLVAGVALTVLGNSTIAGEAGWTTLLIAGGVTCWGVAIIQAQVFYGARRTTAWGLLTISATGVNLVMNFAMVPWFGVAGAAAATLAAYGALAVATTVLARPILAVRFDLRHLATCVVAAVGMAGFLLLVPPDDGPSLLVVVVLAAALYLAILVAIRALVPAAGGRGPGDLTWLVRALRGRGQPR